MARPALLALAAAACLVLLAAEAPLARGAVKLDEFDPSTDARGGRLLTPQRGYLLNRTFYFEIPHEPVGVLLLAHGCVHDASDFWPPSPECPECQGLPEELSHTKQALARGYAVLAIDSIDRAPDGRCFSWGPDKYGVKFVLETWTRNYKLDKLPIFAAGVSAGASFVLKLPKIVRLNGIVSEVLGVPEHEFSTPVLLEGTYPPAIFINMQRDSSMTERIAGSMRLLRSYGVPTEVIQVDPRPVTHDFFADRSEFISAELSRQIVNGLHKIGMIDYQGYVTADPRQTKQPWREQLAAIIPALHPGDGSTDPQLVSEQMNLAFAQHEIISDHLTACLAWLEAQGTVHIGVFERELYVKGRLSDLQAERQAHPDMQDDEALKEAALQVEQQRAVTDKPDENWGDMYASYVKWLKTGPTGDTTFPTWQASRAAKKWRSREGRGALEEMEALGALPQHTAL